MRHNFYHATSSIFSERIVRQGLKIDDFWQSQKKVLIEIIESILVRHPECVHDYPDKNYLTGICHQNTGPGTVNYSHDHIYLNASRNFCIQHLQHNPYGSELLSVAVKLTEKYQAVENNKFDCEVFRLALNGFPSPIIARISLDEDEILQKIEYENGSRLVRASLNEIRNKSKYQSYRIREEYLPFQDVVLEYVSNFDLQTSQVE